MRHLTLDGGPRRPSPHTGKAVAGPPTLAVGGVLLATSLLIATCSAPKSTLPPEQLAAFGTQDQDAATSIVIHRDGQAVGVIHWPDKPQQEHRGVLSQDQLRALEHDLREYACCKLESERVYPYAEEPRVTLSIRWNELDCEVELWADEWTDRPDAKACHDAMLRFVEE